MNISTKLTGLVMASAATIGVVAAVAHESSPSSTKNVSSNSRFQSSRSTSSAPASLQCRYNVIGMGRDESLGVMSGRRQMGSLARSATNVPGACFSANGVVLVELSNGTYGYASHRHLQRQTIVIVLDSRYAMNNMRQGHHAPVWNRTGGRWRIVGYLRWNDRRVPAATVRVHRPTTIIVVVGHRTTVVVVNKNTTVVVADNGQVGIVFSWYLNRSIPSTGMTGTTTTPPVVTSPAPSAPPQTNPPLPAPGGTQQPISPKW